MPQQYLQMVDREVQHIENNKFWSISRFLWRLILRTIDSQDFAPQNRHISCCARRIVGWVGAELELTNENSTFEIGGSLRVVVNSYQYFTMATDSFHLVNHAAGKELRYIPHDNIHEINT